MPSGVHVLISSVDVHIMIPVLLTHHVGAPVVPVR